MLRPFFKHPLRTIKLERSQWLLQHQRRKCAICKKAWFGNQYAPKLYEPRHEKTGFFAYAKKNTQVSFAVTAKLISAFVFATRIVQSLYFLNPKFQASRHILWLCSLVCVGLCRKPRRPVFSQRGSYVLR